MKAKQQLRQAVDLLYARGGPADGLTYSRLLSQCLHLSDAQQAKRLQSHMALHSFRPTSTFLHNRLLHIYGCCGELSCARHLFDEMPQRDVLSYNAMLSAYSKMGLLDDSRVLFSCIPGPDSVSYNIWISALVNHGCPAEGLRCLVEMVRHGFWPTEYTAVSALNACAQLKDLSCGEEVHGWVLIRGLSSNLFVWNALIDMYAKCESLDRARRQFDSMPYRNVVSWNSMIAGYLRHGDPENGLNLFSKMRASGFEPDVVTWSSVLSAYLKQGLMEEARRIFVEIKQKDAVLWTTLVVGHAQNGREEDALKFFSEMLSEDVKPDKYTISSVVSACAGLASLDQGKMIHSLAIQTGIECDLLVSTALVDMYSKCGEITDARVVFHHMRVRNVVSWNSMILGYVQNGLDNDALALYEQMLTENLKPDNITFVGVLSACGHSSLVEEGWNYFHSIREKFRMTPTLDHYACMINLLGRSGFMDEAVDFIKDMQEEPNILIWSTLLSVCRVNGDVKHGEMAAKKLLELEPLDAGPYIMLSNMYAVSGRWRDVASLRSLMKDRKIRKSAAYSWIEVNNKVHKFISDDRTHPKMQQIYDELAKLMLKLQKEGFVPGTNFVLHDVGEKEKIESISYHSEKLALAFGLISKPQGMPIRIIKNIRVCGDCHLFMKLASKVTNRQIVLRDATRFHHFTAGECSCKDFW